MTKGSKNTPKNPTINGRQQLLDYTQNHDPKKILKSKTNFDGREYTITRKSFKNYHFSGDFTDIEFANCNFVECTFENIWAFYFIIKKSKFTKCTFKNSRFSHLEFSWDEVEFQDCHFRLTQMDEAGFLNVFFKGCNFYGFNLLGFDPFSNIWFEKCHIENSQFQFLIFHDEGDEFDDEFRDLVIVDCTIEFSYFNSVDLRNSVIADTTFYKTAFIDCQLNTDTIQQTVESTVQNYASIDFQSILKSAQIDFDILKKFFNITEPKLKNTIDKITSPIDFYTVFISYSFNDKNFAKKLNDALTSRGIRTFIWEKDAPGGKRLDDIMSSGVNAHDKILFIASQHSLKSKACQFELTEARKKQEATWENIFFPVHIDDYLFQVQKNQIRPIFKADEYWENIEEIKRVNSLDFTAFKDEVLDTDKFNEKVNNIIQDLKKE